MKFTQTFAVRFLKSSSIDPMFAWRFSGLTSYQSSASYATCDVIMALPYESNYSTYCFQKHIAQNCLCLWFCAPVVPCLAVALIISMVLRNYWQWDDSSLNQSYQWNNCSKGDISCWGSSIFSFCYCPIPLAPNLLQSSPHSILLYLISSIFVNICFFLPYYLECWFWYVIFETWINIVLSVLIPKWVACNMKISFSVTILCFYQVVL